MFTLQFANTRKRAEIWPAAARAPVKELYPSECQFRPYYNLTFDKKVVAKVYMFSSCSKPNLGLAIFRITIIDQFLMIMNKTINSNRI